MYVTIVYLLINYKIYVCNYSLLTNKLVVRKIVVRKLVLNLALAKKRKKPILF